MRTQKRFTPEVLDRYERQGRGTGTFEGYLPWHRVGRGDPSSTGRSHLMMWRNRQRELLSDGEWVAILFATLIPELLDVREQQPLSTESAKHELCLYTVLAPLKLYPGTLEIAKNLGIKHPRISEKGLSRDWQMTTDQLLVLKQSHSLELLAIAYKPDRTKLSKRQKDLLLIEKTYWNARGVTWLLITPDTFDESVGIKLRETAAWGLGQEVRSTQIELAAQVTERTLGHTYIYTLNTIAEVIGSLPIAQCALWQAVWCSRIPIDLRRGWRPHLPIQLLRPTEFLSLNPIAVRRSAWR